MSAAAMENESFVDFWNDVLTPKWVRFRHLLSGNGKIHSDLAWPDLAVHRGDRVLDVGCGFGETCLELARAVAPGGEVVGLDCTDAFLAIAEAERVENGITNVRYAMGDVQTADLGMACYDVAFSRFGLMFCASPVGALRNIGRALTPGGVLQLLVWRRLEDNPCWGTAEQVALSCLPAPLEDAATCGPGPFSMANEKRLAMMLNAAGFGDLSFKRMDADVCLGRTLEEAIDYQLLVGPAAFVVREAGDLGQSVLGSIRSELARVLGENRRVDGSVWLPSSTWLVTATKPR
jgi:ubiquinone/menaquinone biosynthesis C-methylase UbiE